MSGRVIVLIPALNAERLIAPVIAAARRQCEPVVVIDDGSTDRTSDVAREAGAIVLRHPVNRGKGGALKTGFAYAMENGFDGVITLDADGQHLPADIPKFLDCHAKSGADLIIGGRAHLFEGMLPRRRLANRISSWFVAKLSATGITDSQSGYRFYSANLLRNVKLRTEGFDMETEVIIRAGLARRFHVTTIPIDLGFVDGVATSHYKPVADSLRIAWTVFRAKWMW
jgi:glycosyltransferase involved in cell wall biosynthesis